MAVTCSPKDTNLILKAINQAVSRLYRRTGHHGRRGCLTHAGRAETPRDRALRGLFVGDPGIEPVTSSCQAILSSRSGSDMVEREPLTSRHSRGGCGGLGESECVGSLFGLPWLPLWVGRATHVSQDRRRLHVTGNQRRGDSRRRPPRPPVAGDRLAQAPEPRRGSHGAHAR